MEVIVTVIHSTSGRKFVEDVDASGLKLREEVIQNSILIQILMILMTLQVQMTLDMIQTLTQVQMTLVMIQTLTQVQVTLDTVQVQETLDTPRDWQDSDGDGIGDSLESSELENVELISSEIILAGAALLIILAVFILSGKRRPPEQINPNDLWSPQ